MTAHIFRDSLDTAVAFTGAAIAGTFALIVVVMATGLVGTALVELAGWLTR